ncbi:holin [Streptomyces javensis]|uniref:holin n=1 Tax=Streptomyces javensis TaxID=114698 RepID=UPI0033DDBAC5
MANAPIERKVTAATAAAYVGSAGLLGALAAIQDHERLLEWMPDGLTPFVLALIPTAITAVSGWKTKHTPRDNASALRD